MDDFFEAVDELRQEYEKCVSFITNDYFQLTFGEFDSEYKPELERLRSERAATQEQQKQESLSRLMRDMSVSKNKPQPGDKLQRQQNLEPTSDEEENDDEEEDEGEYIDQRDDDDFLDLAGKQKRGRTEAGVYEDPYGGRWPAL